MIYAKYRQGGYYLGISNLHSNADEEIDAKFDTGASATVFTISSLYDGVDSAKAGHLRKYVLDNGLRTHIFQSASGTEMFAVKCYKDDVCIGRIKFDRFYYWLVFLVDIDKALLGDDFIKHCTFSHADKSDILISSFNMESYVAYQGSCEDKIMSSLDVLEIIGHSA